ncbi:MAG: hypothetical protein GF335_04160, partial [Candidatus Moranbacteria bacterium]|nr:hypothetical protein [Candidatus Moranbacteria bacterium]
MPQLSFEPFTSTKTSLLFAQKKTKEEIEAWNDFWVEFSTEWTRLMIRCEKELEFFVNEKPFNKKWAIARETEKQRKENVLSL